MNCRSIRLAMFSLGRINFDTAYAQQLSSRMYEELYSRGYEIVGSKDVLWNIVDVKRTLTTSTLDDIDLILVFQTTFTDSSLLREISRSAIVPIVLWSVPENWDGDRLRLNSFAGMQLAAHSLHKNQIPFFYFYSEVDNPKSLHALESIASAASVVRRLRYKKIGLIGDPPAGFETSEFDSTKIRAIYGITVEKQGLHDFFTRIKSIPKERINTTRDKIGKNLIKLESLDQIALEKTIATYEALIDLQKEWGLDGLAVRCWPEFFEDLGCSACGALSMAAEVGVACSCEADAMGLITQLILQMLSDSPTLGVDIVGLDHKENTAAIWHCGMAPISMANPEYPVEATVHSNRGLPLLMQFPFKPGKISLARLTQADEQTKLIISSGDMLDRPRPFTGTCGVFRFDRPTPQVLDTMMSIGMEHHISFTYGDYRAELEVIAKLLGLPVLYL